MQAVTGLFKSQAVAERAVRALRMTLVPEDKVTLLTPGDIRKELKSVPIDNTEQPGVGKALGTVVGAAGGFSGAAIIAAFIPGVGLVSALGLLGEAILTLAGAGIGAAAGESLENKTTEGLPEDEIFLYEDVLRRGLSVVLVMAEDAAAAGPIRDLLKAEGAEAIDAARHHWWTGLRDAEQEHYESSGQTFGVDNQEKFYRIGFEAALHAKTRCKEFDQISAEMTAQLEEVQKRHPGADVEKAFVSGYQRGRDYYQRLCDESRAA